MILLSGQYYTSNCGFTRLFVQPASRNGPTDPMGPRPASGGSYRQSEQEQMDCYGPCQTSVRRGALCFRGCSLGLQNRTRAVKFERFRANKEIPCRTLK
jgi:hypothetical protein